MLVKKRGQYPIQLRLALTKKIYQFYTKDKIYLFDLMLVFVSFDFCLTIVLKLNIFIVQNTYELLINLSYHNGGTSLQITF